MITMIRRTIAATQRTKLPHLRARMGGYLLLAVSLSLTLFFSSCGRKELEELHDEIAGQALDTEEFIEIEWLLPELADGEETPWFRGTVERQFNVAITPKWLKSLDFLFGETPLYSPTHLESGLNFLYREESPLQVLPDCGILRDNPIDILQSGWIRTIPKEMIRTYMPGYSRLLDDEYPLGWNLMSSKQGDPDEYMFLYFPEARDFLPHQVLATRVDWARAVGIEFPDYERNKIKISDEYPIYWLDAEISVQWWEQLLKAYRDGDPDGNGQNDTQPWPATKYFQFSDSWMWGGVHGIYGQTRGPILKDGEFTFAEITENFKEWCKLMQRWNQEKFFFGGDFERSIGNAFTKIADGQIAATPVSLLDIKQGIEKIVPPVSMAKDSEIVILPPLVGPNGDRGWFATPDTYKKGLYVMII
jgi:hypothetical protein